MNLDIHKHILMNIWY